MDEKDLTFMRDVPVLHIYAQAFWHDEAAIAGNIAGMTALRDALDALLKRNGTDAELEVSVIDGEWFTLHLRVANEIALDHMNLPYTAEIFEAMNKARTEQKQRMGED